ncbi:hypothetical protein ACO0QE_004482 [Hanseniaspora vineae]
MVYVNFNIPRDIILSQLQIHYGGDNNMSKICITGEFDGWKQCDKNTVYLGKKSSDGVDNTNIKIGVELPEGMQKSEFKMVIDGYKWLTLDGFAICDNTNNVLDINALNEYFSVSMDKKNIPEIPNTNDNTPMFDVILESAYNSQILTDPEYQSDCSVTSTNNNTREKSNRQVDRCRKDRDNPKYDPNTIIVLDNMDIHTHKNKNYTYSTTKNSNKNNNSSSSTSSSSSTNESQISDDAYSVYRYEQLDIEEHYLDDNEFSGNDTLNASHHKTESYANIVSNTEYNIANKQEDSSMNGSLYSAKSSSTYNKSQQQQQQDKNKYIIPMQMENGMCTPTSMSTLSTSSLLKSSNSNTSLMQQGSVKLSGSSSNKMKLKALMKSFFWRE